MKVDSTVNWHKNIEILFCTSGIGYVKKNNTRLRFNAGDIIIVNSEEIHSVHRDPFGFFRTLIIDRQFCAECGIPSTSLIFQSRIRDPQMAKLLLEIIDTYERYTQTGEFYEVIAIRALTLELLCRLCRDYLLGKQSDSNKRDDALKTAITYIREHLSEPITMDALKQLTGLSDNSLLRRFKQAYGRSVIDTILVLRCTEAKRLLEKGASVAEAARACGFENLSYFARTFKRHYQHNPSYYLQKKQSSNE